MRNQIGTLLDGRARWMTLADIGIDGDCKYFRDVALTVDKCSYCESVLV